MRVGVCLWIPFYLIVMVTSDAVECQGLDVFCSGGVLMPSFVHGQSGGLCGQFLFSVHSPVLSFPFCGFSFGVKLSVQRSQDVFL